jgi:hypothetical protein
MLHLSRPRQSTRLAFEISETIRRSEARARVLAGFAYANLTGVQAVRGIPGSDDWTDQADGRWIFGIANGVTEPRAIRSLLEARTQEVRLFVPKGHLNLAALLLAPRFHAKVIAIEEGRPRTLKYLWTGSANATSAAMSVRSVNFEARVALTGRRLPTKSEVRRLRAWWDEVWGRSVRVTSSLLDKYTRIRGQFRRANPYVLQNGEPPALPEIRRATELWIEAGAMSGGARNQIEFTESVAAFFGAPRGTKRIVEIEYDNRVESNRPLTPKTTTYGVSIWRLGLPTGVDYIGKIVHLKRLTSSRGHPPRFGLEVAEKGARHARKWYDATNESGYVGWTRRAGGKDARQYGLL